MLVDKVYSAVSLLVNKDQVSGYLPPDEYSKYAEFAQREYIDTNYSPMNGRGYESTFKMTDDMSDVKKQTSLVLSAGQATIPTDYLYFSHAQSTYVFKNEGRAVPVELVRDDEWAERLASEVNKPSKRFPIMRKMDTYFDVYPQDINNINLTYLKVPLEPWWNYTLSGATPVFSSAAGTVANPNTAAASAASTDFEITDFTWLVWRIALYFGVETADPNIYQVSKQEGQST